MVLLAGFCLPALIKSFTKFAREGRVKGHWMIVSTQLFSDIDSEVRENLNTRFVLRQNTSWH